MQAENRRFETMTLKNRFLKYIFIKTLLALQAKNACLHAKNFGRRIVFQKYDLLLAQNCIFIFILLFIIIIKHLQHKASKAIEKTVCS